MAGDNPLGGGLPMPADPNQAMAQAPPPPPTSPTPTQQPGPQVNPAAVADVAHHSMLGKAFRSLMGNEVNYSVDPSTGKLTSTPVEQKPGALWRGILAGALLGGSVAAKDRAIGPVQGMAEGGAASIEERQKQDLIKRQQARQEFEDQLKAKREGREEKSAETEDQLRKAQIAFHNAQTLHENMLLQKTSFDFHQERAKAGQTEIKPYIDAGIPYAFKDVSESEHTKLLKDNPQTAHLLWEPTGTRVVQRPDGTFDHEMTYSAVDPKGDVKLTDDWVKSAKEAGLDQVYGKATWDILKKDKSIPVEKYMAMNQKVQELTNAKLLKKKQAMSEEEEASKIALQKAQAAHFYAEAARIRKEGKDKEVKEKTYTDAADALEKLRNEGKGFDDLPIKYQDALADHSKDEAKAIADMLKNLIQMGKGDTPEAADLYKRWDTLNNVHSKTQAGRQAAAAGPGAAQLPALSDAGKQYISSALSDNKGVPFMPKDKAGQVIWGDDRLPPDQKLAVTRQYGAIMPWSAVVEFSSKVGIKPEVGAEQLKAAGIQVEAKPAEPTKPTTPEEVSTSGLE